MNFLMHRAIQRAWPVFIVSLLLIACTSSPTPSKPATAPTSAADAPQTALAPAQPTAANGTTGSSAPAKPTLNRLVLGVVAPPRESNEIRQLSPPESWPMRPMYEFLIGVDPTTGKFIPQLATAWSLEPDGMSYRFKLRHGVLFHGGWGEFTAKDVVHSFDDFVKPDSYYSQSQAVKAQVKALEVVNDYEVVFRLNAPDSNFLQTISEVESGLEIRSKAHYDAAGAPTPQQPPIAGTGPYQYKDRLQSSFIRYERVPYQHWRVNAEFPEFEYRFMKEPSTRMAALQAGEIQITTLPEDLLNQAQSKGFKIIKGKVPGLRTFLGVMCCFLKDPKDPLEGYTFPDPPLLDNKVRTALNKAINRDELNKAFFGGKGETLYLNHYNEFRPGWNPDWVTRFPEEYGYDPAKARALLSEAGKPNLSVNLVASPLAQFSGAEDIVDAVAGYWRAVGLNPQIVQMEASELTALRRQLKFDNHFEIVGTSSEQFTGVRTYNSSLGARGRGVEFPEANDLLNQIKVTLDEQKQDGLWRQLGNQQYDQHNGVPLFWLPAEAVVDPKVVGDYVFPGSLTGTWTHVENIKATR